MAIHAPIVYLIDDEPDLIDILSDVVALSGLEPRGFVRARTFFNQVTEFTPGSILILDLQMPEIDGIEVMRHLAKVNNPPELILISGQDKSVLHAAENLAQAHQLVVLQTLVKPVQLDCLKQLLDQHAPSLKPVQRGRAASTESEVTPAELRRALDNDELVLYYQPQVDFSPAGAPPAAAESLVRWLHPEKGLIYPDSFIPMAEKLGWMPDLTNAVINKTVAQQAEWQAAGLRIKVSVNISASDITSLVLPEKITVLLEASKLDPTLLTLEVTESELMGELVTSLDVLTRLRLKEIGLSIDDFGTGYSSMSQLYRVPFTELKIDRSFISKMAVDAEARVIVRACLLLAEQFHMRVVAEGVEDRETWDLLAELGCDSAQGYFIAKPMPAAELPQWFEDWACPEKKVLRAIQGSA